MSTHGFPGRRAGPGRVALAAALLGLLAAAAPGDDWPQFRGPQRDGVSRETGLLRAWPEEGPAELWRARLGAGFSGAAVVGPRVFTMDSGDELEYVVALAVDDGRELWRRPLGALFEEIYGDGPRSMPTVEGDTLWALGSNGDLVALRAADGEVRWHLRLPEALAAPVPQFGYTTIPLVAGDRLVIQAPGEDGHSIFALDKATGRLEWRGKAGEPSYSSPIRLDWHGVEQWVFLDQEGVSAWSPEGEPRWRVPFEKHPILVASPLFVPPDGVFVSASYDIGGMMVRMRADGEDVTADPAWRNRRMRNHFNTSVARDGLIYGFDNATLKCLDAASGEEKWAKRGGFGKGSLIWADGHLVVLTEQGAVLLLEGTGDAYREKGRATVLTGRTWTPPSLADGRLYLRSSSELVALDLRAAGPAAAAEASPRPAPPAPGAAEPVRGVDDILARHLQARGGAEALARLDTLRIRGHYFLDGDRYPFTAYYKKPNLYRFESRRPDGETAVIATDGETGWRRSFDVEIVGRMLGAPVTEIPADQLALLLEDEADFAGALVAPREKGHRVELLGSETLDDGRGVYHLEVTLGSGRTQHFYVDRESFTLAGKTAPQVGPVGLVPPYERRYDFHDHRRVEGLTLPFAWEREDYQLVRTFRVEEVDVDPELPPGLFAMPRPTP